MCSSYSVCILCSFTLPSDHKHRYSNVYGIDMPSRSELVAYHRSPHQIAEVLGADLVIFQTLPDLISSVQQFNPELKNFDCSVFTGEYVTGDIDERYLAWVENSRSEKARLADQAAAPAPPIVSGRGMLNGGYKNGVKSNLSASMKRIEDEEAMERREVMASCSGPMNGADDIVGLHNTFKVGSM